MQLVAEMEQEAQLDEQVEQLDGLDWNDPAWQAATQEPW